MTRPPAAIPSSEQQYGPLLLAWTYPRWRRRDYVAFVVGATLWPIVVGGVALAAGLRWQFALMLTAGLWLVFGGLLLVASFPRRVELRPAGILMRTRFIPWSEVAAYRLWEPGTLSLELQHRVELWGTDRELVEFPFPPALRGQLAATLAGALPGVVSGGPAPHMPGSQSEG